MKLPDGKKITMSAFRTGNNEEYLNHVIAMFCLLEQKGVQADILKAFKVVKESKEKIEPLATALPTSGTKSKKEEHKLQLSVGKQDL